MLFVPVVLSDIDSDPVVVRLRDRHDFQGLLDSVRFHRRYPLSPFSSPSFYFFTHDRCPMRISNPEHLAKAALLSPHQLHGRCLRLYLMDQSKIQRNPVAVEKDPGENVAVDEERVRSTEGYEPISPAPSTEAVKPSAPLPISVRPYTITPQSWALLTLIAGGSVRSVSEFVNALSDLTGRNGDQLIMIRQYLLEMGSDRSRAFFAHHLPAIARLAMAYPAIDTVLRSRPSSATLQISHQQAASVIANLFLCSYALSADCALRHFTCTTLFSSSMEHERGPACAMIDCLIHYLSRHHRPDRHLTITRHHSTAALKYTIPVLLRAQTPIRVKIDNGTLRHSQHRVQLSHSSEPNIAIATLNISTEPDHIRMFECPDLLVAGAMTDPLSDRETVLVKGARRILRLKGDGEAMRIAELVHDDEVNDEIVFYSRMQRQFGRADGFHPDIVSGNIRQMIDVMAASDQPGPIAMRMPVHSTAHQVEVDRQLIIAFIAASAIERELVIYSEGDERLAHLRGVIAMIHSRNARVCDLARFLSGYKTGMGRLWTQLQDFLSYDQSISL